MTTRRFFPRRVAIGASVALFGLLAQPATARADQIGDMRAQASHLAAQIDVLGVKESALSEQYDKAVLDRQQAEAAVGRAEEQVRAAAATVSSARASLERQAVAAYTGQGRLTARAQTSIRSAEQAVVRDEYASVATASQSDVLDRYRTAQLQVRSAEEQLSAAARAAAARLASVDKARSSVQASQARLQATYAQVKGQLATLVAQAQAAREAERQRQAQQALAAQQAARQAAARHALLAQQVAPAPTFSAPLPTPARVAPSAAPAPEAVPAGPVPAAPSAAPALNVVPVVPVQPVPQPPVPTGSGGSAAVAAAESRLGDPYVWGAAGPNSFDCSGLTMWAWAHAGVSLPHYSAAQYESTTHIPMSDLQPGDLVFFADPGEHEAMYIGNGQIVEAPHTGANVRIMPLYSQFVLASRP